MDKVKVAIIGSGNIDLSIEVESINYITLTTNDNRILVSVRKGEAINPHIAGSKEIFNAIFKDLFLLSLNFEKVYIIIVSEYIFKSLIVSISFISITFLSS